MATVTGIVRYILEFDAGHPGLTEPPVRYWASHDRRVCITTFSCFFIIDLEIKVFKNSPAVCYCYPIAVSILMIYDYMLIAIYAPACGLPRSD